MARPIALRCADLRALVHAELTTPVPPACMSRQIDEPMPHHGYKQHDELDGAPEYVFLPARPPSIRERIPIHNDS